MNDSVTDDDLRIDLDDILREDHRQRQEQAQESPPEFDPAEVSETMLAWLDVHMPCELARDFGAVCVGARACQNCQHRRRYVAIQREYKRQRDIEAILKSGPSTGYRFEPIDVADFLKKDLRPEWLVKRQLVKGQPGIVAGTKKTLKTSTGLDLAISLASKSPYLGYFDIYKRQRVAFISGESGEYTIQETTKRIVVAKDIDPESLRDWLVLDFRLPQMNRPGDIAELSAGLRDRKIDVMMLDPVYLCLLAGGGKEIAPSDVFAMGERLNLVARACLDVGVTPLLYHHAKKNTEVGEPIELEDISFAGFTEFARQWMLLSRRDKFEPGTGSHHLWLSVGGSMGQSGCWALDIEEGELDEHFGGRKWEVSVRPRGEEYKQKADAKEEARTAAQTQKDKADDGGVMNILRKHDPEHVGMSRTRLGYLTGWGRPRVTRAIARLVDDGLVEEVPVEVPSGKNKTRPVEGLRILNGKADPDTGTDPDRPGLLAAS